MAGAIQMNRAGHILDQSVGQAVAEWTDLASRLQHPDLVDAVLAAGRAVVEALTRGNKLIIFGNGGSAAMASHVAAEFSGKCIRDRQPLPAISLADSAAAITALGNDYGFERIFTRGMQALGVAGDVAIGMSTSGTSPNVIQALHTAREQGLVTILLTGAGAPPDLDVDHVLRAPSISTPRVQEVHLLWTHAWCEAVDTAWATQD